MDISIDQVITRSFAFQNILSTDVTHDQEQGYKKICYQESLIILIASEQRAFNAQCVRLSPHSSFPLSPSRPPVHGFLLLPSWPALHGPCLLRRLLPSKIHTVNTGRVKCKMFS